MLIMLSYYDFNEQQMKVFLAEIASEYKCEYEYEYEYKSGYTHFIA